MKNNEMRLGRMMGVISFILLLPILFIPFFKGESSYIPSFIIPFFSSIVLSFIVEKTKLSFKNISLTITFIWIYGFFILSFPFLIGKVTSFLPALFESISGLTTTGLSVLNVEKLPSIFLLYRAILQYIGGLGFIMMMLLFLRGNNSVELFEGEGHYQRIRPSIYKTAKTLILIYVLLLIIGVLAYVLCGMSTLDSFVHSMCALSTGGFSNKVFSIGAYDSLPIEIITAALMLFGMTDFSLLFLLFCGKIKDFFHSTEIKTNLTLYFSSTILMVLILSQKGFGVIRSIRISFFNGLSALSTTGFSTLDYTTLPDSVLFILIILMIIGGGMGSTAGGIKLERVSVIYKTVIKNVKKRLYPENTVIVDTLHKGKESIALSDEDRIDAFAYFALYLFLMLVGSLIVSISENTSMLYSTFEFVSSLSTVGLSIGITGETTTNLSLIVMSIGMILGRLEIFVVLKAILSKRK